MHRPLREIVDELIEAVEVIDVVDHEAADRQIRWLCEWWQDRQHPQPRQAASARLNLRGGEPTMGSSISVDSTTASLQLAFEDDHGDATGAPTGPDGQPVTVTYASDNPAVATVDPTTGKLTEVAAGTFNASATVAYADGTPALEPDGVTPFTPAPVEVTVTPGAAATDVFSVNS